MLRASGSVCAWERMAWPCSPPYPLRTHVHVLRLHPPLLKVLHGALQQRLGDERVEARDDDAELHPRLRHQTAIVLLGLHDHGAADGRAGGATCDHWEVRHMGGRGGAAAAALSEASDGRETMSSRHSRHHPTVATCPIGIHSRVRPGDALGGSSRGACACMGCMHAGMSFISPATPVRRDTALSCACMVTTWEGGSE